MSTEIIQPKLGLRGWLRWAWRTLTSMRTALMLLLLVAIAAVPGSLFPQRNLDAARTADWIAKHEKAGPILDRLGFFSVYSSPWFAAIYILLFISLLGCVIPRTLVHLRGLRAPLPAAPRNLARLSEHSQVVSTADEDQARALLRDRLKAQRYRVRLNEDGSISAEKGFLRETGNLIFHFSLLGLIVGMAYGYLWGWRADIIVPEGQSFVNTPTRYDTPINAGPMVDTSTLHPFVVKVDTMISRFNDQPQGRGQFGQPRAFSAEVTWAEEAGAPEHHGEVQVNDPLEMSGATVYLLGNGYAPKVTVRDKNGKVLYAGATSFLAQDNNYKSVGAIKVPAASPKQLGFVGLFLPTAYIDPELGPSSLFPDIKSPALALSLYEGELFPKGRPQSVYSLDTESMKKVLTKGSSTSEGAGSGSGSGKGSGKATEDATRIWLTPGQTAKLPGDRGSITFDSVSRFAGFSVRHDPGKEVVLISSVLALLGLIASLVIKRRRVFVRFAQAPGGATLVDIGALTRDDDDGLAEVVADLAARVPEADSPEPLAPNGSSDNQMRG